MKPLKHLKKILDETNQLVSDGHLDNICIEGDKYFHINNVEYMLYELQKVFELQEETDGK